MKFTLLIAFHAILCATLLLQGCKTAPDGSQQPDIERIAATVNEAAAFGSEEVLRRKPDLREEFTTVVEQLTKLEAAPAITLPQLQNIVAQLPVKELQSDNARLIIGAARITVAAAGWSSVEIVRTEQLRPVVTALKLGLQSGMSANTNVP